MGGVSMIVIGKTDCLTKILSQELGPTTQTPKGQGSDGEARTDGSPNRCSPIPA